MPALARSGNFLGTVLLPYYYLTIIKQQKCDKKLPLRAGFEPARGNPIGFRVQRLNHSAIAATDKTIVEKMY